MLCKESHQNGVESMKPFSFNTLLIFCLLLTSFPFPSSAEDYRFFDEEGNEVVFPGAPSYFTQKNPGPWSSQEAGLHAIKVKAKFRKSGLENIRILKFTILHPPASKGKVKSNDSISAVYLLDKDNLLIGFQLFDQQTKKYEFECRINGIINYVQVYIYCGKHGIWKSAFTLPLDKHT